MTETNTIYDLCMMHVKPKYLVQMMHMLPTCQKIFEKHGAKQLGVWLTETGDMCRIVRLMEWPSMEKRMTVMALRFKDTEMMTYFEKCRRFVMEGEDFICKADTHVPVQTFSDTAPMWIERYTPKKCDPLTTQKLLEMTTLWERDFSTDCTLNAMLHPVCYSDHCMFTLWQMKDGCKMDRCANKIFSNLRTPTTWTQLEECNDSFVTKKSVICSPINLDKLPKLT